MEIYQRVLSTMPQMFSTNEYLDRLKKVASDPKDVISGKHIEFIKSECRKVSNRTYVKRQKEVQLEISTEANQPVLNEQNAAELLKSLNYKVFKPNWTEI